jgi:hypothetical protein
MSDTKKMGGLIDRHQIINAGGYFLDQRFDWTSGDLDYRGVHEKHNAATTDTGWIIWKYSYTGDNVVRIEGPLEGAWDSRTGLDWG